MQDLKFSNGRFLEVTHTNHNNSIPVRPNSFSQKSKDEQLKIMTVAKEAYDRIQNAEYEQDDNGKLTEKGKKNFRMNLKL